jgi:hypothetical protein
MTISTYTFIHGSVVRADILQRYLVQFGGKIPPPSGDYNSVCDFWNVWTYNIGHLKEQVQQKNNFQRDNYLNTIDEEVKIYTNTIVLDPNVTIMAIPHDQVKRDILKMKHVSSLKYLSQLEENEPLIDMVNYKYFAIGVKIGVFGESMYIPELNEDYKTMWENILYSIDDSESELYSHMEENTCNMSIQNECGCCSY